jgi:hypothetical protein
MLVSGAGIASICPSGFDPKVTGPMETPVPLEGNSLTTLE